MANVNPFAKIWRLLKIRWKLFVIILPTAIIPLVVVIIFSSLRIYSHLENQGGEYYATLLTQVKTNMEFVYNQYARTFSNIFEIPGVKNGLTAPSYRSKSQELAIRREIIGEEAVEGGLRNTVEEKIDGYVFIYESDRKSRVDGKDYVVHKVTGDSYLPDYEKLIQDPLFTRIKEDNNIRMIFGSLGDSVIPGEDTSTMPVVIFPYYLTPPTREDDTFEKFLLVLLKKDFIPNFYQEIESLQYGTLYILDQFDNIISRNHPGPLDFYPFDQDRMVYTLGDNQENDPESLLGFSEYQMLNSDPAILESSDVIQLLERLALETSGEIIVEEESIFESKNYVSFNKKRFLTVVEYGEDSNTKFIYFHPIKQIQKPILEIISILFVITAGVILLIIIISYLFSKTFTNPIKILVDATKVIAQGDYNHYIKTRSTDEIGDLSENFNKMIKNIKVYQDKLLSAEREKSELELASRIQTCLLPTIPERKFYDITATMIPAAEVGGDYYDLIGEAGGRIWFGIGDVSGHGLTSGLIMMMAQTAFNTILLNEPSISSNDLIVQVNKVMYQNIKQRLGEDHFMTLSFMVAEPDGRVKFAGAHLDVLVYRAKTGEVERIETSGVWLGLIPDIEQNTPESTLKLEKDDVMMLYTDGLIEATDTKNQQYDMPRLMEILGRLGKEPVKVIEETIIEDVFSFLDEQKDDITFVIARKKD
jgi:serine phosphatase RsbU (regulator of sigma subunit)